MVAREIEFKPNKAMNTTERVAAFLEAAKTPKPTGLDCTICNKPIMTDQGRESTGEGLFAHDDCYFESIGDLVESYPIGGHVPRFDTKPSESSADKEVSGFDPDYPETDDLSPIAATRQLLEDLGLNLSDYEASMLGADIAGQRSPPKHHKAFENYFCILCGKKLTGIDAVYASMGISGFAGLTCSGCYPKSSQ